MDPTNNNPANDSGSGGESLAGAGVPSNAGTVNSPAANVASQRPSPTTGSPSVGPRISSTPNMTGTRGTGAFAPGAYRPMSARPMNSGMMPAAQMPIASGSGDIVLSKDTGGSKSKKWWIIGGAIGAVLVVALVVLAIINNSGFGGPKATDLRSAFNIYANYFLTGEAKDEDLPEARMSEVVELGVDEEEETEELEVEIADEEESEEDEESSEEEESSYFYENVGMDEGTEYRENIREYFETFYDFYMDAWQDDEEAVGLMNEYKNIFDLIMLYYDGDGLSQMRILEEYDSGGEAAAEEFVSSVAASYEDLDNVDGTDYYELVAKYGMSEIDLIKKYKELGCLAGTDIDYDCVPDDAEIDALSTNVSNYDLQITSILDNAEASLHTGIYTFRDMIYGDLVDGKEEDNVEEGEDV